MTTAYDDEFFEDQRRQAQRSAREIVPIILTLVGPRSVVDVGCGGGAWLEVFKEHQIPEVLGIDGAWAETRHRLAPGEFIKHDLSQAIAINRKFDLVVCLEVAEHVQPQFAADLVQSLVSLGDVVLFSAAIPLQGGTLHVNEQWPDYWAALFAVQGYHLVDCIRKEIWDNERVDWWYAQNAMVFVRRGHETALRLAARDSDDPVQRQLNLVHPRHYLEKARLANIGLSEVLRMLPGLVAAAIGRRVWRSSAS